MSNLFCLLLWSELALGIGLVFEDAANDDDDEDDITIYDDYCDEKDFDDDADDNADDA